MREEFFRKVPSLRDEFNHFYPSLGDFYTLYYQMSVLYVKKLSPLGWLN